VVPVHRRTIASSSSCQALDSLGKISGLKEATSFARTLAVQLWEKKGFNFLKFRI